MPDTPPDRATPLLASEALRAELAPAEPWRLPARMLAAVTAPIALGVALSQWGARSSPTHLGVSGLVVALAAAAAFRIRYGLRAWLLVAAGATGMGAGSFGVGAAAVPATSPAALAHALGASAVGGALLFRSWFRAYAPARRLLGFALLSSVPLAAWTVYVMTRGPLLPSLGAALLLLVLLASLLGFMGSDAVVGETIAGLIALAVTASLAADALGGGWPPALHARSLRAVSGPITFGVLSTCAAMGLGQRLAQQNWRAAREVDLHRDETEPSVEAEDTWSGL